MTEGGRRLYSEDDARQLRAICFLKDLEFSLKDISGLLESGDFEKMLKMLVDNQEEALKRSIDEDRKRLDRLDGLRRSMDSLNLTNPDSLGVMADIVNDRRKLKSLRVRTVIVGVFMDLAWIPLHSSTEFYPERGGHSPSAPSSPSF